jgi:hypothetical protein
LEIGHRRTVDEDFKRSKLRRMSSRRRALLLRRSAATLLLGLSATFAAACEHAKPSPGADTIAVNAPAASGAASEAGVSTWDAGAGPLLLVATETPERAIVVAPDSADQAAELANVPHPATVTLLGRGGTVQTASLPAVSDTGACVVATLTAALTPRPWSVGFIGGVVLPLPMDSLDAMSRADSNSLTAAVTRLASTLPNDSAGRFTGLPFVVHTLWRFRLPGRVVVAGTLERQINQEATPLEERTFVIAERDSAADDSTFAMTYSDRSYGAEETIESRDALAAVTIGPARAPSVVLSLDFGDAVAYRILQRGGDGRWHARWSSGRWHCS